MNNRATKTLGEVTQTLANAIADFVEHPDSPEKECGELADWFINLVNEYDDTTTVTIRRDLPWIIEQAVARRMWPSEIPV
jgi:hypothetical protein